MNDYRELIAEEQGVFHDVDNLDFTMAYEIFVKHYGCQSQVNMAIEEMSELTKELCKSLRGKTRRTSLREEIADVEIMLEQLKSLFEFSQEEINEVKKYKITRALEDINMEDCDENL